MDLVVFVDYFYRLEDSLEKCFLHIRLSNCEFLFGFEGE